MNSDPGDASAEIAELIETLHRADLRLDELTAGEVDSISDQRGRTLMLRRAQNLWRTSEVAKQVAILNALPAHIAVLDPRGVIVAVNEAWRRFGEANALLSASYGIGTNYPELCDRATGPGSTEAVLVAAGLRSVLDGGATSITIEYPCHSSAHQSWYLMTVTPLGRNPPTGAVVMHLDISDSKLGEEGVTRFGAAMDTTVDGILLIDRSSMRIVYSNDAARRFLNQSSREMASLSPWDAFLTSREELERNFDALIASGSEAEPLEIPIRRADQSMGWMELRRHAVCPRDRWTIVNFIRDVTERRAAAARISYLNRIHAVLSGINTLIVRVGDRDELFKSACQIAVEHGQFKMAWIGVVDLLTNKIMPVASFGVDPEFLALIRDGYSLDASAPLGNTLTARAVREKASLVSNEIRNDPKVFFVNERVERGISSMVVLPLMIAGEVVGVLSLFAAETGFFSEEELKLLNELAGDIGFALDHLEKRDRLDYLGYYDAITGLPNRTLFLERLNQILRPREGAKNIVGVALLDVARFHAINDTFGRPGGDELLRVLAQRLLVSESESGTVARVGVDCFAILIVDPHDAASVALHVEQSLRACFEAPFHVHESDLRMSGKAGIALFPVDGGDAEVLLRNADAALKRAKRSAEGSLFYAPEMNSRVAAALDLESKLRTALDLDQFVLHYQPKFNAASGALCGVEALIRWNDPQSGLVPPGRFIPILEDTGQIYDVGRWALGKAVEDYLRWLDMGLPAVRVAVNVSPLQLRHRAFNAEIERAVAVDPRAAGGLELEITESVIMEDVAHTIVSLKAIRLMRVTIAIDDFGTGFSSLSYLSRLPVDTLKIDRSFVTEMTVSAEGLSLVSTIVNLAHSLKLKVVAEGVETEEQAHLLRLVGCDELQGFLLSRPVPGDVFESRFLKVPSLG